jgi:hypothetical protein
MSTEIQIQMEAAAILAAKLEEQMRMAHRASCGDQTKLAEFVLAPLLLESCQLARKIANVREALR